jgi:hypothetical protein
LVDFFAERAAYRSKSTFLQRNWSRAAARLFAKLVDGIRWIPYEVSVPHKRIRSSVAQARIVTAGNASSVAGLNECRPPCSTLFVATKSDHIRENRQGADFSFERNGAAPVALCEARVTETIEKARISIFGTYMQTPTRHGMAEKVEEAIEFPSKYSRNQN